jgi:MFS family permease
MNSKTELAAPPALLRWFVLLVISLAMMGNYYVYDSISPLADLLKEQLKFTDANIGTLNAIYSMPNIFMVLIGGIIIDRIGTKKSALIFSLFILLGAFITYLSGNIIVMATGRLVFGLGAESMIVAITTGIARWFKGKELSFAFGLNLTLARVGSFMALNSPSWARGMYTNWHSPLLIPIIAGGISVITLIIYYAIDKYAEDKYSLAKEGSTDKVIFSDIFKFGKSFWYITFLCITFYSAMFPFQTFAVKFFHEVHGASIESAGFLSSMLTLAAMVCTPLFGLLADKIGKRSLLMMFGSMLIIPVYLMMGYKADIAGFLGLSREFALNISFLDIHVILSTNLFIPMCMMGIAFSLIPAVMWPAVALVVEPAKLGTAYGLMTMIQNIGLFGFNLMIGYANDVAGASALHPQGYRPGMWIFSICGILGVLFAFLLRSSEKGAGGHGLEQGSI